MRIKDDAVLELFRGPGECEVCGKWCERREPHHAVVTQGAGGSDVPENLVALGASDLSVRSADKCRCHRLIHDGNLPRLAIVSVIALREGKTVEQIDQFVRGLRRKAG